MRGRFQLHFNPILPLFFCEDLFFDGISGSDSLCAAKGRLVGLVKSFGGFVVSCVSGSAPRTGLLVSLLPWVVALARSVFLIINAWPGWTLNG